MNRNTGETVLHKAARLGYHVSIMLFIEHVVLCTVQT